MATEIKVPTPLGTLIAQSYNNDGHPGIQISLRRPGFGQDMPVAQHECSKDEIDCPINEPLLLTHVWDSGTKPYWTHRIRHEGISSFFRRLSEDEEQKERIQKAEQCLVDNGIDPDEAQTVLQALGYILNDEELYPMSMSS